VKGADLRVKGGEIVDYSRRVVPFGHSASPSLGHYAALSLMVIGRGENRFVRS
jgi:hypothetical protein